MNPRAAPPAVSLEERAAQLRRAMVERLTAEGDLSDPAWRDAFAVVPRHLLVPRFYAQPGYRLVDGPAGADQDEWLQAVYSDTTLITQVTATSVTSSGTMPSLIAAMLQHLDITDDHNVLHIGTGTGYTDALLAQRLAHGTVTSIDIDPDITRAARHNLAHAGYQPTLITADGALGHPPGAPYDRILATCGLTRLPEPWLTQTRPGGKILAPIAAGLALLDVTTGRTATGRFLSAAYFMPLRPQPADAPAVRPPISEPAGSARQTALPSMTVYESAFRFHLSISLPGLTYGNGDSDLADLYLTHPDGSTAHISPHGSLTQDGPRNLWDLVEIEHARWHRLGRPRHPDYQLTLDQHGQRVELGDDHTWPLPG